MFDFKLQEEVPSNKQFNIVPEKDASVVSAINPNLINGPWIAGGAVRKWINGEDINESDIDVFCKDENQFEEVLATLRKYEPSAVLDEIVTDNATTLKISSRKQLVQIVKHTFYENPQEIIDNFDISVCQLVTDGDTIVYGEHTFEDLNKKQLRMVKYRPGAIKRLTKYFIYGYTPIPRVVDKIVAQTNIDNYSDTDNYDNAF